MSSQALVIAAVTAELWGGIVLFAYRREAAGAALHRLRLCSCPSWKRCETMARRST